MSQTSESLDLTRFDVRDIPCRVKHAQIFQRWLDLPVGQHFVLINDHDPIPLYYQFDAQFPDAVTWEYLERGPDEFHVKITKTAAVAAIAPAPGQTCGSHGRDEAKPAGDVQSIDVRGLEAPEPLIRILNALESLPAGITLRAITDRRPCHLFDEAEQRGFRHDSNEQPDGSWITTLARA